MTGRRVSLPGADELFRSTSPLVPGGTAAPAAPALPEDEELTPALASVPEPPASSNASGVGRERGRLTGRERHEEKITVYCSSEELMDLERARLTLRGDHGVAVDRGRIVRAAVSLALAELEAKGRHSRLLEHLRTSRGPS